MKRVGWVLALICVAVIPTPSEPVAHAQGISIPTTLPTIPGNISVGPMLSPLTTSMLHAEVRTVIDELIAHLPTTQASRVRGVPLKLDPGPNEINAYAGCDAQ